MAVRVTLNNAQIRALTGLPTGAVYDWCEDEAAPVFLKEIKVRTPIRSGQMHRKMKVLDVIPGPRETVIRVGARGVLDNKGKPYIHKVIRGTGGHGAKYGGKGKIHPIGFALGRDGVPFGNVNRRPGKRVSWAKPAMAARTFRGQEPNDFMQQGMRAAMRKLGLL